MHLHREAPLDDRLQIRTPPPHHPIVLWIGTRNDQRLQLRLLCVRQPWRTARAATRLQAVDPAVVVAMHPVPQGLSVHSGPLRASLRGSPSNASAIASSRRTWAASSLLLAAARRSAAQ